MTRSGDAGDVHYDDPDVASARCTDTPPSIDTSLKLCRERACCCLVVLSRLRCLVAWCVEPLVLFCGRRLASERRDRAHTRSMQESTFKLPVIDVSPRLSGKMSAIWPRVRLKRLFPSGVFRSCLFTVEINICIPQSRLFMDPTR
jgi:hypothetical protein